MEYTCLIIENAFLLAQPCRIHLHRVWPRASLLYSLHFSHDVTNYFALIRQIWLLLVLCVFSPRNSACTEGITLENFLSANICNIIIRSPYSKYTFLFVCIFYTLYPEYISLSLFLNTDYNSLNSKDTYNIHSRSPSLISKIYPESSMPVSPMHFIKIIQSFKYFSTLSSPRSSNN